MLRKFGIIAVLSLIVAALAAVPALAQSGHFIDRTVECRDIGTQVRCTGKVAGLGGTTFTIRVAAQGTAEVVCRNPAGRRAPGQDTAVTVSGSSGPLATPRNGQFNFSLTSANPSPLPSTPTCPNNQWTANIVDVEFTNATLTLFENGSESDRITVPVT